MKIYKSLLFLLICALGSCLSSCQSGQTETSHIDHLLSVLNDPSSEQVMVISHRGDWRNFPENSIPAIESVIRMGADMVEVDIWLTKDSVLVLSHDHSIDRMTDGHGTISSMTLDSLKKFHLRRAHGITTDSLTIPTLEEALLVCKDRILVNIDKGYDYYDQVLELTERLGVTGQVLIKGKKSVSQVASDQNRHEHNLLYMPVIDVNKEKGVRLFKDYVDHQVSPLAYELCWKHDDPILQTIIGHARKTGSKLWVNTLWPSLCGGPGNDDDAAYMNDDPTVYQKFIDLGFTMIQTDHPQYLLDYLRNRGLHE